MHGLVNRALETFLKDRHGPAVWQRIRRRAGLPFDRFEPLLVYDTALTDAVIAAASAETGLPRDSLLEDLGTALVSHRDRDGLRRLLRFGGVSYRDFLHSLEELPDRARLAWPDLLLPEALLEERGSTTFALRLEQPFAGAGFVLMGLLRAMADDYGALVLISMGQAPPGQMLLLIQLLDESHGEGRRFDLAAGGS